LAVSLLNPYSAVLSALIAFRHYLNAISQACE
jgi:hypothetical protein